jgi:hypothetical protein
MPRATAGARHLWWRHRPLTQRAKPPMYSTMAWCSMIETTIARVGSDVVISLPWQQAPASRWGHGRRRLQPFPPAMREQTQLLRSCRVGAAPCLTSLQPCLTPRLTPLCARLTPRLTPLCARCPPTARPPSWAGLPTTRLQSNRGRRGSLSSALKLTAKREVG